MVNFGTVHTILFSYRHGIKTKRCVHIHLSNILQVKIIIYQFWLYTSRLDLLPCTEQYFNIQLKTNAYNSALSNNNAFSNAFLPQKLRHPFIKMQAHSRGDISVPLDVLKQIFEFIHACGYFHLFYFRHLREANDHRQLPISGLICMNDTSLLEKFQHVLLSFTFREKIRILVAQFGSVNTIEWFISKGVTSWNSASISTILARRGALKSVKLLIRTSPYVPLEKILYTAAKWGRANIIQCFEMMIIYERKINHNLFQHRYSRKFLEYSALGNQLNVILWMLENYPSETLDNADSMYFGAVRGGHIEMLEWIIANMPQQILEHERQKRFRCGIVAALNARNEQLHVLQCLQENGYKFNHRAYTQAAACSGSLEVLQYLRNLFPPCPWSFQVCNIAVKQGNLDMLQWAISNGCPYKNRHMLHVAASKKYLEELW